MLSYLKDIGLLTVLVYSIVESLEKFGVKRKYAHLLAIPIGVIISILGFPAEVILTRVIYGFVIGILSVGSCDTVCNAVDVFKKRS